MSFTEPLMKSANCHKEKPPTATTKNRQLPQRKTANCHNKTAYFSNNISVHA